MFALWFGETVNNDIMKTKLGRRTPHDVPMCDVRLDTRCTGTEKYYHYGRKLDENNNTILAGTRTQLLFFYLFYTEIVYESFSF